MSLPFQNLKIKTQLLLGFFALLVFVFTLGWFTLKQNQQLHNQTEILHRHPLTVQRAIGTLHNDVLQVQLSLRDLFIAENDAEALYALEQIKVGEEEARIQLEILRDRYLGPSSDIDSLYQALAIWIAAHQEAIRLFRNGDIAQAANQVQIESDSKANDFIRKIDVVKEFAKNKESELYNSSIHLYDNLNNRLLGMLVAIFLIALGTYLILSQNIRKPLSELTRATKAFRQGNHSARSAYASSNEFGELSDSFNLLAHQIEESYNMNERIEHITEIMLNENQRDAFFHKTLKVFMEETSAQMALVYLLDEDQKTYRHYLSIGAGEQARLEFDALNFEGEPALAVSSGKIQHTRMVTNQTRFLFYTPTGKVVPNEMITIPITNKGRTIAFFTFCSTTSFSEQSLQLCKLICVTLNARVQSVLAFRSIELFSEKLESQNRELEVQKSELTSQSIELREQNYELERQQQQLTEASMYKTSFLSNMSHELRTPLNSVIALTGVLSRRLEGKIPEVEYSYLEVVERNGKHLLSLINDILDLSRIESGREQINASQFDACTTITDVVKMLQPQASQKKLLLNTHFHQNPISVTNDEAKFRHILINLAGNAIKFTDQGKVEITTTVQKNMLEVHVTDTGIGIDKNDIELIFEVFRQADNSTSKRFGGTGLGLSIAKKYALLLGGLIRVTSKPGAGSTFTLVIPLKHPLDQNMELLENATEMSDPAPGNEPWGQKTILLVDDSEPTIIQMQDFLEQYGFNVLTARGGQEALTIMDQSIPDAIVLDLMMPQMDGFDVLRTIREAEPTAHIPVLILTAKHITREELKFLKSNNVHQLIQKGDVSRHDLIATIRSLLQKKPANEPAQKEIPAATKPRVLVVEDNPDNMITVKALLNTDYHIVEAVNGKIATEMAQKHRPDLILMDIALPEINGIEAFKIIRSNPELAHIPIIALTASALTREREIILEHGFDAYIPKPIESEIFFQTIKTILYEEQRPQNISH